MILDGMGPVDPIKSGADKIFASFYALYSRLAIISVGGLLFASVVHRFLINSISIRSAIDYRNRKWRKGLR
jgi:hypothetical protein